MKAGWSIVALQVVAFAVWARPVHAQTPAATGIDLVLERLQSLERRLEAIERRLGDGTKPVEGAAALSASTADVAEQLESLNQAIRIVDRKRELDQEAAATRAADSPVVAANRDGFTLRSADGAFQMKVNGYFQADGHFFTGHDQVDTHTFLLRRIRPILQGTFAKAVDFRIVPDWGLGVSTLQEAHLDFRYFPRTSVRFGKFKSPFGLERLQSAVDLSFTERALPTSIAPNRDVGIQIYGDLRNGAVSYAIAALNGVPDGGSGDADNNDGKDLVARLFVQPFLSRGQDHPLNGLGIGFSISDGNQAGTSLPSYRTAAQSTFFSYVTGVTADGNRRRYSPQAYYYFGPFGLMGEYVRVAQDFRRGTTTHRMVNSAWEATASYFLTGEQKFYRTTTPLNPFDPATGKRGAIELVARVDRLTVDGAAFAGTGATLFADPSKSARDALAWWIGVNWHVTRNNKLMLDYAKTRFHGGASPDRADERAIMTRYQIAF